MSLNREESTSNLVQPGGFFDIVLTLDPTLGGGEPLVINNFEEPALGEPYNGFIANSTKPGRGLTLDGLLTPCHGKLTEFDRHVLAILQRIFRAGSMSDFHNPDIEIALFRGENPDTYRLNVYPIYENFEPRGRMAVELQIFRNAAGKLITGEMRALSGCVVEGQSGCTSLQGSSVMAYLIPPVFGGHEYSHGSFANGVFYVWYEGPSAPKTIDLEALLANTTWNEPVR